jgi:hypothetical protein
VLAVGKEGHAARVMPEENELPTPGDPDDRFWSIREAKGGGRPEAREKGPHSHHSHQTRGKGKRTS